MVSETRRRYSKIYYQQHKEEMDNRSQQWQKDNRERQNKTVRKYRENNEYAKRLHTLNAAHWRNKNREKHNEICNRANHKRRALEYKVQNTLTREEWLELLEEYNYCCVYCFSSGIKLVKEHKIPISRGGHTTKQNIVPACKSCNSRKKDRTIEEWLSL